MRETLFNLFSDEDPALSDQDPTLLRWIEELEPGWQDAFVLELRARTLLRAMLAEGQKSNKVFGTVGEAIRAHDEALKTITVLIEAWRRVDEITEIPLEVSGVGVWTPDLLVESVTEAMIVVTENEGGDQEDSGDETHTIKIAELPTNSLNTHRGYLADIESVVASDEGGYRVELALVFDNQDVEQITFAQYKRRPRAQNTTVSKIYVPCNETSRVEAPSFNDYVERLKVIYTLELSARLIKDSYFQDILAIHMDGIANFYNYLYGVDEDHQFEFSAEEYAKHVYRLGEMCDQLIGERDCIDIDGSGSVLAKQINAFIAVYIEALYTLLPTDRPISVVGWGGEAKYKKSEPEKLSVDGVPVSIGLVKHPTLGIDELALFIHGYVRDTQALVEMGVAAIPVSDEGAGIYEEGEDEDDEYTDDDLVSPGDYYVTLKTVKELDLYGE